MTFTACNGLITKLFSSLLSVHRDLDGNCAHTKREEINQGHPPHHEFCVLFVISQL